MATTECNKYDAGDAVRMRGEFTVDEAPTNPTTTRLLLLKPGSSDSEELTPLTNPEVGTWEHVYEIPNDAPAGFYRYRMEGTGAAHQAEEKTFQVRERGVPEPA